MCDDGQVKLGRCDICCDVLARFSLHQCVECQEFFCDECGDTNESICIECQRDTELLEDIMNKKSARDRYVSFRG